VHKQTATQVPSGFGRLRNPEAGRTLADFPLPISVDGVSQAESIIALNAARARGSIIVRVAHKIGDLGNVRTHDPYYRRQRWWYSFLTTGSLIYR
jgi:hypothetical protein